jgi:acetolactate synthase-1/3 small subunit
VGRELALIKVRAADPTVRAEITQIASIFRSNIVDITPETLMIEVTGKSDKVDAIVKNLAPYEILELVRTGLIVLTRGAKQT